MPNIKDIPQGSTITFRSKNVNDLVVWRGTLESIGTFRSIRALWDPRAYNEAVRQSDPTVSSDLESLTYFTITIDNQSTLPQTRVFAAEWVQAGSLLEVALAKQVTIKVDDPNNDTQRILAILAEAGYSSIVVT